MASDSVFGNVKKELNQQGVWDELHVTDYTYAFENCR